MAHIYSLKCKITSRRYVGLTINVKRRKGTHFSQLKNNSHYNSYIQRHYNKYGSNCFEFEILEECDESILEERETYWIAYYKSFERKYGFNLTTGGENWKLSEEAREKRSESNGKKIKVGVYTLNGDLLNVYNSITLCGKELGICRTSIGDAIKSKRKVGNFLFCSSLKEKIDPYIPPIKVIPKNSSLSKKCYVFDKEGNFLSEHETQNSAAKFYGIKPQRFRSGIKNRQLINKRYYVFNTKEFKPSKNLQKRKVYVYNLNFELVKNFNSIAECAIFYNIPASSIPNFIRRKNIPNEHNLIFSDKEITKPIILKPVISKTYRKVYVYDLNFELINEFISIAECIKYYKVSRTSIEKSIKNKTILRDYDIIFSYSIINEKIKLKKLSDNTPKTVFVYKNNELINKYNSYKDCCEKLKMAHYTLKNLLKNGKKHRFTGLTFSFEEI